MSILDNPEQLVRLTKANYGDGVGTPVQNGDPITIADDIFDQDGNTVNSAGLSNLFVAWGQFLDHDLSLSLENKDESLFTDGLVAPLHRSEFEIDDDGARVPTNAITWQVDGSQIYGSTQDTTAQLRSGTGGHLRMGEDQWSDMGLLPDDHADLMEKGGSCPFAAGDIRANENPALASMHTMMAREHNYWADRLAEEHPDWDDGQLFAGARQIVEYELQKITYEEWLPKLIGDAAGEDTGYDPDVNGQISVEFSTAAFRFGHTMVSSDMPRIDDAGAEIDAGDMNIMDVFGDTDPIREAGIDAIIRGAAGSFAQELDTKVVDDLNFFLFSGGTDGPRMSLVALNILRGQDHGLQSYVDTRAALLGDIDPETLDATDFSIITADETLQGELAGVYATVYDVDLWVGGLAEDAIAGTQMGPLFTYIIAEQFARTRAADETFGDLDPALGEAILAEVRSSTMQDVIMRNTEIDLMQDDPFLAQARALTARDGIAPSEGDDLHDLVACDVLGLVDTGAGDDTVTITGGTRLNESLLMGAGDDTLIMSSGKIIGRADMGAGDDSVTLSGGADVERLVTGSGDDTITVTQSARVGVISTDGGADTLTIGARATVDWAYLGDGEDRVNLGNGAHVHHLDGGDGTDTLNVTGGDFRVDWLNDDPSTGEGHVVYLKDDGSETGKRVAFRNIENIACFTAGTRIITAGGARRIEDIAVGDKVYTLDHGLQPVKWIGTSTVLATGDLAPVRFDAGAIGNLRAFEVSPQHRMLLSDWRCDLLCGADEALAPALTLTNDTTIKRRTGGTVTYIHLMFAQHEIIFGDGVPSESFHPGTRTFTAMDAATQAELLRLFPALVDDLESFGPSARTTLKRHEVALIKQMR
jgi:peroxidase